MDFAVIFPAHLDVTIRPHRVNKDLHTHASCRFNHSRVGEKWNKFKSVSTCHRPVDCCVRLAIPVSRSYSNISLSWLLDLAFEILFVSKTFQYLLKDIKHVSHYTETRVCVCVCVCVCVWAYTLFMIPRRTLERSHVILMLVCLTAIFQLFRFFIVYWHDCEWLMKGKSFKGRVCSLI
jgi:hypothetical protein